MINNTFLEVIKNIWPMLTIFLVVIIVVRIFKLRNSTAEFCFYKEIFNLLFIIYILLLFELVTNTEIGGSGVNLVPFTEILRHSLTSEAFFRNVLCNIIIFIPFGYFVSSYVKAKKISTIFIITLITSLTIELVQLKIGRAFDVDDIILNVSGGVLGFLIFIALSAIKKHLPGLFQKDFIYNLLCLLIIAMIALYFLKLYGIWWF